MITNNTFFITLIAFLSIYTGHTALYTDKFILLSFLLYNAYLLTILMSILRWLPLEIKIGQKKDAEHPVVVTVTTVPVAEEEDG